MTPQDLLFIQAKISNSFLRAFYPTDYRAMQRQMDKASKAANKEVVNVKKTERLTSDLNSKLGRVLGLLEKEIDQLVDSLDRVQVQAAEPPVSIDINAVGNALDESGAWMLGLTEVLRSIKERNKAREKARKAEEKKRKAEEKNRKVEEERSRKAEEEKNKQKASPKEEPGRARPSAAEPSTSQAPAEPKAQGDVKADLKNVPKSGSVWESVKDFGGKIGEGVSSVGKGAYALAEGVAIKGAVVTMAAVAAYEFLVELYDLKVKADAGKISSNEFRKEVVKLIVRLVDAIGLAYAGAVIGAFVGSAVPVFGTIVGFIGGIIAGAAIQYAVGDTVESMTDYVIDTIWPGDATVSPRDQAAPSTPGPVSSLSPISTAQASVGPEDKPASAAQLAAQVAIPQSTPPELQTLPDAVPSPSTVASPNLEPPAAETVASIEQTQRDISNRISIDTSQQATSPADTPTNNQASFNTASDQAGGIASLPPPTGSLLGTARQYLGMSEGADRETLNAFISKYFMPWDVRGDANAWCAAFVNAVLGSNQLPGTGSAAARSFLNYGASVWDKQGGGDIASVQPGDIAVFSRGAGHGHVGFVQNFTGDNITVLGGNQSDSSGGGGAVTESARGTQQLLSIRRPALAAGGKVHPKNGGTLTLIAEAGEPEYVVPQSKVTKFAHEMLATRPRSMSKSKTRTHVVVMPIYT